MKHRVPILRGMHGPGILRQFLQTAGIPILCLLAVPAAVFGQTGQKGQTGRLGLSDLWISAFAELDYLLEPEEGDEDAPRPLCLVLPGGPGDEGPARGAMSGIGKKFVQRGWAVAVPIAPGGKAFMGRNGELIPKLIRELQRRDDITDDPVVVAGVSNGGIAAMEIGADEPDLYSALIAIPGVLSRATRIHRLDEMPIYLRVGENDRLNWAHAFPRDVENLTEAGALLDARLLSGVGHGVPVDWAELDRWLIKTLGDNVPEPLKAKSPAALRIPSTSDREIRRWRAVGGSTVVASLVRTDAGKALLRLHTGKTVEIDINRLSDADQQYLVELAK